MTTYQSSFGNSFESEALPGALPVGRIDAGRSVCTFDTLPVPPNQLRWNPLPMRTGRSQMVAHHTVNGCNLRTGDLFGSGTLSGPTADQGGSLLELTLGGKQPIRLANG